VSGLFHAAPLALGVFVMFVTAAQLFVFVCAIVSMRLHRRRDRLQLWRRVLSSPLAPTVSVIVPAYNEEATILDTVQGLLALLYARIEVVIVNDGSSDNTLDTLIREYHLSSVHPVFRRTLGTQPVRGLYRSSNEPRLVVLDKVNGASRADAMNAGLNVASSDLVCGIDADTLVAPEALQQMVAPFLADARTIAVGGTLRLTNGSEMRGGRIVTARAPRRWLAGMQVVEYARAFLVGRVGWNLLGGNIIVSGAFGLFRREELLAVGGYEHGAIGEDMELVVRMRRRAYERGEPARVEFLPEPVAWTQAPEELRSLANQRNRWYRGLCDVLARHRSMIGRPRYGSAGLIALPYYLIVEALSPFVEVLGFVIIAVGLATGWIGLSNLYIVFAAYAFGAAITIAALGFDETVLHDYRGVRDRVLLASYAVVEQLVYRPLTVFWRMWGFTLWVRGRSDWGHMERTEFGSAA
jgi:cellulose synthase/poly-beta-1,6-N-acetylglucosamine synthase-like glycosyltransferase